jgi:hypothetical protein
MSLSELAAMVRWFEGLADVYERNDMPDTAKRAMNSAAEYRAEMERRPDSAE